MSAVEVQRADPAMYARRSVLSDFLKNRRARLRPEQVGFPIGARRRIAGLRREEVAALAGVGDTWYGLFESGKDIRVSERVVAGVSTALRLTSDEVRYFQDLVETEAASEAIDFGAGRVDDVVLQTIEAIANAPAFVIGPRLDYLAMNSVMRALYSDPALPAALAGNLIMRVFLDPLATRRYPAWPETAARAVAKLRRNYGPHVGNRSFEELIAVLSSRSSDFLRLWQTHDVGPLHEPLSDRIIHPWIGCFNYHLQAFSVPGGGAQSLVVMLPRSSDDVAALAELPAGTPERTSDRV